MKKLNAADEAQIARNQWDRYIRARDNGHLDYIDMAKRCDAFYRGEQWDEADIAQLDSEGRPALTINTILPTVNTVLAEQTSRRADVQFKPRRGGEQATADTLTKLYMQLGDANKLDWVESQVFSDGLIADRGYFDVRMDFDDHIEGEVRIKAKDPLDILIDPDAKEWDPKTWNEVFETKWMSVDEIEEVYGLKMADRLRMIAENGSTLGIDSIEYEENRYGDTGTGLEYGKDMPNDPEELGACRSIRVIERQYRRLVKTKFYVDPQTGDQRQVPEVWGKKKIEKFAELKGQGENEDED